MAKQEQTDRIASFIEKIEGDFGVEVEVTGGGKGWTATAGEISTKAESKMLALEALHNRLDEAEGDEAEGDEAEGDEEVECSEECQNANPNSPCTCRCGGINHPRESGKAVVVFGSKPCACGCGQITKRRFAAGHDAAFHFAERARKAGYDDPAAYKKALKAERNKIAAAKRREKRAAEKVLTAKAAEVAKTIS